MKKQILCDSLIIIAILFSATSCASAPKWDFADSDLLIDQTSMPAGWKVVEYAASFNFDEGEKSGAYIVFETQNFEYPVRGGEDIYRYTNKRRAAWQYRRFEETYFNNESVYRTTPWKTPDLTFESVLANQWRFACAGSNFAIDTITGPSSTLCTYLAQYGEFLTVFNITIERNGQSYIEVQQVLPILYSIDRKIGEYLNQEK